MNSTNVSNSNSKNNGQQSGRGNGFKGCGCGNSSGHSNGGPGRGRGNGGCGSSGRGNNNNFINQDTWNNVSRDERQAVIEARKHARSANNMNVNSGQDNESTIAGPPTAINVANGVDGSNGNNRQANTTNQAS